MASRDTLVFDIETQNFFTDPEVGWNNYEALRISVVGVYSYIHDRYTSYTEEQLEQLADIFLSADTIVGFSSNRYDVPVLHHYFQKLSRREHLDLWAMRRIDLLELIEMATGKRVSLNRLAQANLGLSKTGHGSHAITLYKEGRMSELADYCLQDVRLTKDLYDLYRATGSLRIPNKDTGTLDVVSLSSPVFS
ncbi:MAG: hypothetical protein RIQ54_550 [Candidatus Parcubacteria bacterium]|jgi:DEAD/DEAH box helicase domain-containing protein